MLRFFMVGCNQLPGEESLSGGLIVEAIVTRGVLTKLKAKGFEVCEIPPRRIQDD
jgi:hypothetical protein